MHTSRLRFALALFLPCVSAGSSHVSVDKFCSDASIAGLRWDGITHLTQAFAPLGVDAAGTVAPQDATAWAQWSAPLVAAAHGNGTKILLPLHIVDKPTAAQIFATPFNTTLLTSAARAAATLAVAAGYDGIQLDIEGLKKTSAAGFEFFARAVKSALCAQGGGSSSYTLSATVYMPKLVVGDFGTYNITRLTTDTTLCDFVFLYVPICAALPRSRRYWLFVCVFCVCALATSIDFVTRRPHPPPHTHTHTKHGL